MGLGVLLVGGCHRAEVARPTAGPPALHVESARLVVPEGGGAGSLHVEGRFAGLTFRPDAFVRFDVGENARWLRLGRRHAGLLAARSREHGYALALDLRRGTFTADEPGVLPRNPLPIALGKEPPLACTMLRFRESPREWTFEDTRDEQLPCEGR